MHTKPLEMTMYDKLNMFQPQIKSIVLYAKKINFDFETGDMDEMLRGWLEQGRKFVVFTRDNEDEVLKIVKRIS